MSNLPSGKQLAVIFQALNYKSASLTVDAINLVDPEGTVLQSIDDVVSLGDNMFVGNFTPPAVSTFHWQISGQDEEGYSFSRISDTAIEVSDIDLKLGILLLYMQEIHKIILSCYSQKFHHKKGLEGERRSCDLRYRKIVYSTRSV